MRAAAAVASRLLKRTGTINGVYRVRNHTKAVDVLGYTEINQMATTPFSRTKTHKAWFAGDADITEGDHIEDRVDGKHYLVMSLKPEFSGDRVAFFDGTLYYANARLSIQRLYATDKDAYGRDVMPGPATLASDIPAMITPLSFNTTDGEDQIRDISKVRVAVQATLGVQEHDRLVTDDNEIYRVVTIDRTSLDNLWLLGVEPDTR